VAVPVRRPSLVGAGIVSKEIENTWEQAMKVLLAYCQQTGKLVPVIPV
jgi:hypothetical protein